MVLGGFYNRWLRIPAQNSEIQDVWSNMATQSTKIRLIDIKLGIQGTFRNKRSLLDWDKSFWGQANVLEVLNVHMNEIYKI